jgi:hypothetical protein
MRLWPGRTCLLAGKVNRTVLYQSRIGVADACGGFDATPGNGDQTLPLNRHHQVKASR